MNVMQRLLRRRRGKKNPGKQAVDGCESFILGHALPKVNPPSLGGRYLTGDNRHM